MQENVPIEEVFENLKCTRNGLSSDEVKERLELFGYNKLEEKKVRSAFLLAFVMFYLLFQRFPLIESFISSTGK